MARSLCLVIAVLLVTALPVGADGRGEINIEVPAPAPTQASGSGNVCITDVIDNRTFEDRPAEANIPSVAEGGVAGLTPEKQSFMIGRVRDGHGKARNNIFSKSDWPVDVIVKRAISDQLAAMGYSVVSDPGQATITVEVSIDQLWGYILVRGGGWGGSTPKMAGEISVTLATHGPGDRVGRYEVSGKATHKFGLMTGKHWTLMFSDLLTDAMKDLGKVTF